MSHRARAALFLALAAALLWLAGSALLAQRLVHPPRASGSAPPRGASFTCEDVRLTTRDGLELAAWIARPAAPPRAVVLLLHERHGHRSARRTAALAEAGFAVLAVDHRGCGESAPARTGFGWHERLDVEAAARAAAERFPGLPRLAWGTSLGAAALVYALDPAGDVGLDAPPLAGVILESLYPDLDVALSRRVEASLGAWARPFFAGVRRFGAAFAGIEPERLAPERVLPRLSVRLLLLGGEDDVLAPPADLLRLSNAAPTARVLRVSGAGHARAFEQGGEDLRAELLRFLTACADA